eukprot:6184417-Pleurochrysis_carterae.AAC.1
MILGYERYPGGVAAWLLSLVYLIGECELQKRGCEFWHYPQVVPPSRFTYIASVRLTVTRLSAVHHMQISFMASPEVAEDAHFLPFYWGAAVQVMSVTVTLIASHRHLGNILLALPLAASSHSSSL